MRKKIRNSLWMMTIVSISFAMLMTACSNDSDEPEKPFVICPPSESTLYACGISESGTRSVSDEQNVLFTEDDIEWFNIITREINFKDKNDPIYKRLEPFHEIKFYLGDNALFAVSSFVGDWDSRIFTNLVLHYDMIIDPNKGHYYLQDCYPLQFIDTDEVKANIKKNAEQWELFTNYLESKGKLKK